jgi:hypothetical protein
MVLHTTRADHGESGQNRSNLSSGDSGSAGRGRGSNFSLPPGFKTFWNTQLYPQSARQ